MATQAGVLPASHPFHGLGADLDPQLERTLNLSRDFNDVVAKYGAGVSFLERTAAELTQAKAAPKKRPWWKFW